MNQEEMMYCHEDIRQKFIANKIEQKSSELYYQLSYMMGYQNGMYDARKQGNVQDGINRIEEKKPKQ